MSMQVSGQGPIQENRGVGEARMSPRQFYDACKAASFSTPKAALSAIKFAFSGKEARAEQQNQLKNAEARTSTPIDLEIPQAAKPPKKPLDGVNHMDRSEWDSHVQLEYKTTGEETVIDGRGRREEAYKEAAAHIAQRLKNEFPGAEILNISPNRSSQPTDRVEFGVIVSDPEGVRGEERCVYVVVNLCNPSDGEDERISGKVATDKLKDELNKVLAEEGVRKKPLPRPPGH